MWPGYTQENLVARLTKIGGRKTHFSYLEVSQESAVASDNQEFVFAPILDSRGKLKGRLNSIYFCENAFRDQLRTTTILGNFWSGFRFATTVFFFAMVIVFSGGANPKMDTLSVIELFGSWSIMEIAFNRGILASFKYGQIGENLGISLRLIVTGIYSSVWLEIVVLLFLLNSWNLFNKQEIMGLVDYAEVFFCIFSLLTLSLPFSYFVSLLSRNKVDLRFLFPVFFKFLVFTTPLFLVFQSNFLFVTEILRFNPLNFCFSFLTENPSRFNTNFAVYSIFVTVGYLFFVLVDDTSQPRKWMRKYV
jgi:hypothetical protein